MAFGKTASGICTIKSEICENGHEHAGHLETSCDLANDLSKISETARLPFFRAHLQLAFLNLGFAFIWKLRGEHWAKRVADSCSLASPWAHILSLRFSLTWSSEAISLLWTPAFPLQYKIFLAQDASRRDLTLKATEKIRVLFVDASFGAWKKFARLQMLIEGTKRIVFFGFFLEVWS